MELIKKLLEGWDKRPVLFVAGEKGKHFREEDQVVDIDDPRVVRAEVWIVPGEQYVFCCRLRDGKWSKLIDIGEYEIYEDGEAREPVEGWCHASLDTLLPMVRRYMARGLAVHPLLAEMTRAL